MPHKFKLSDELEAVKNTEMPVLMRINIGTMFYITKGKRFKETVDFFLSDVDRGLRGLKNTPAVEKVVAYCKKFPQINKVSVDLLYNGQPQAVLTKEAALLKKNKSNPECLNDPNIPQYKPEWMQKDIFHKRCVECNHGGVLDGKKTVFRFCPNCGHINKK